MERDPSGSYTLLRGWWSGVIIGESPWCFSGGDLEMQFLCVWHAPMHLVVLLVRDTPVDTSVDIVDV